MSAQKNKFLRVFTSALLVSAFSLSNLPYGGEVLKVEASGQVWNFGYTGNYQTWTVPYSGKYQLETWGAQGGDGYSTKGGKGGYSKGEVVLQGGESVYVYVGGQGSKPYAGWNGGGAGGIDSGSSQNGGGGGGATDIRTSTDVQSRLIVAGGGAGGGRDGIAGVGGGLSGTPSESYTTGYPGQPGTQTGGGNAYYTARGATNGSLGLGGRGSTGYNSAGGGGGGGGYYGGGGGTSTQDHGSGWSAGGGGGSGYIGRVENGQTIAGSVSFLSPNGTSNIGHSGNGFARITALNAPAVATISAPAQNIILNNQDTLTLKGTILDPDSKGGSMKIEYAIDNGARRAGITVDSSTNATAFSIPITLPSLNAGNHTLRVFSVDNEGVEEEKNISFRIRDNVAPTLNVTGNPTSYVEGSATLQVTASDNSGSTRIKLPDGNYITGSSASFVVSKNGSYTFVAEDEDGNQTTKTVFVDKIRRMYNPVNFGYTGAYQTWTVPNSGTYKVEVWGAEGGWGVPRNTTGGWTIFDEGGKGAYSKGTVNFKAGEHIYIYVGGKGSDGRPPYGSGDESGGWNGGGKGYLGGGGGGATDIRTDTLISSRIIVAGGGGGASIDATNNQKGGHGGGLSGGQGGQGGVGGTQTSGYSLGQGGNATLGNTGGGGGGYYGGNVLDVSGDHGGGGGSGYIGGVNNGESIDGGKTFLAPNGIVESGHTGNGFAKITPTNSAPTVLVSSPTPNTQFEAGSSFSLKGTIQDADASGTMTVKYSIDGGQEVIVSTMTNLDTPQDINQTVLLPNSMTVGNHVLRVWGEDSDTLQSEIISVPFSIRDNIAPEISVTGNVSEWTSGDVTLTVKGMDNESGVKRIQLPDGTWVSGSTSNFLARQNGSYTFVVEDGGGNQVSQTVVVSKIDKSNPASPTMIAPDAWSKDNVVVSAESNGDTGGSGVGLVQYMLQGAMSKAWSTYSTPINVTAEGTTTISTRVLDNAGNLSSESAKVVRIDKSAPELTALLSTNNWTNQDVSIALSGSDGLSGVKSIQLPNGNVISGSNASYAISKNGTYTFTVEDEAGNVATKSITVLNIDKGNPTATHSIEHVDGDTYKVTVSASDNASGMKRIKLPNGEYAGGSTTTYQVQKGETYAFELEDIAGNTSKYDVIADIPELNVYQKDDYVKAEWAIEIMQNLLTGYAKSQLFRGNDKVYEGTAFNYEDQVATDKTNPNPVDSIQVSPKGGKVFMKVQAPSDNGTEYEYKVKAVSNKGDILASEKKKAVVTAGIDGYSYVVDTNTGTIPDNTIDTKSTEVQIPVVSNDKYYVHIKSIDKAGNVSDVKHLPFQDNVAPEMTLSQNPTTWTNTSVQLNATANDVGLGVKRIQLPNGTWVDGETASQSVTANGTYTFVVEDLVGNRTTKTVTVTNIDKTAPTAPNITNSEGWVKVDSVAVTIQSGIDNASGVAYTEYRMSGATNSGWTRYNGTFQVSNEGETFILARTVDKVGIVSSESDSMVRIDRSTPHNTGITIKLKP